MIERILPEPVVAVDTREEVPGASLLPEEEVGLGRAVEKRRVEFATARACARQALQRLGVPPVAIPVGPRGEPVWPDGIVGSITHCDRFRACAAARAIHVVALGIDAEPNRPLPRRLLSDVAGRNERARLSKLVGEAPFVHWDRLLFSAKEAVYKAWFPLTRRPLGFDDADVEIDPARGRFSAKLLAPGCLIGGVGMRSLSGRWLVCDGILLTAIAVPAKG